MPPSMMLPTRGVIGKADSSNPSFLVCSANYFNKRPAYIKITATPVYWLKKLMVKHMKAARQYLRPQIAALIETVL